MIVLFLKSFAAFMGLTLLMAWCHWLYEEEVNIGFYTDNAKWVLLFCVLGAIAECLGVPLLATLLGYHK